MAIEDYFKNIPPSVEKLDSNKIHTNATFIGSAGFEDRCFSFLDRLINSDKKIENVIGIEYRPFNPKNRKKNLKRWEQKLLYRIKLNG